MHTEIQVALKFVISFLYNKLPRRRVNLFGEELENALRDKFQGHWYPDKPFKGSAYRCLKITDPTDPVLNRAARESGNPISDIIENLASDLAIWIDPGEVSYRMGEKGAVKILYSEKDNGSINLEDISPDVRGFLALDTITSSMNCLSLSQGGYGGGSVSPLGVNNSCLAPSTPLQGPISPPLLMTTSSAGPQIGSGRPPLFGDPRNQQQGSQFNARQTPVVYTAATFAQTKFGSTKLKTNSKKPNRMSPTEFSNYIKQRAMQKSLQQDAAPSNNQQQFQTQQSNGYFDKFGYNIHNNSYNSNNANVNFNNFPKSMNSPGSGSNSSTHGDYNYGLGSTSGQNGFSAPNSGCGLNMSDYSSLLSDWPDKDSEANAFLQDIFSDRSTSKCNSVSNGRAPLQSTYDTGCDSWSSSLLGRDGVTGLGQPSCNWDKSVNANHVMGDQNGRDARQFNILDREISSRSSSTKSMTSSGSEGLPSPPGREDQPGFTNPQQSHHRAVQLVN